MKKRKTKNEKRADSERGFSLVELLVAATIFTFVVMSVSQLFAQALELQRRASGFQKIQENALFILESIAREVRVSTITTGDTNCSAVGIGSADELIIEHPDQGTITYRYSNASGRGIITRESTDMSGGAQPISSDDVDITKLAFCIDGAGIDDKQTRVTIPVTIQAVSGRAASRVEVSLQTTIVSRDLVLELTN